jgi:ribosomal protein S27AE
MDADGRGYIGLLSACIGVHLRFKIKRLRFLSGGCMSAENKNCPRCGHLMNYHADKPDRSAAWSESETTDTEVAVILKVYTCPACKNVEAWRVV